MKSPHLRTDRLAPKAYDEAKEEEHAAHLGTPCWTSMGEEKEQEDREGLLVHLARRQQAKEKEKKNY